MRININRRDKIFMTWMLMATFSIIFQFSFEGLNLGILMGILMIPILIHDILSLFFPYRKNHKS